MSSSAGREFSAGGVVLRGDQVVVIVPRRRAANGRKVLTLPKGNIDPGETPEQAATREVREETGIEAELVGELGDVRYFYQRSGRRIAKRVVFYLFRYRSGDTADHDDEVEEARWMGLPDAVEALSYAGEREMVERARSQLEARPIAADGRPIG
ncbi:MAG TPA: NUDIX hydrolase [Solirubrobacteraceae bacterium]|nr:NUDIX hydrolase [Solirubrobacteraceae bacterium]